MLLPGGGVDGSLFLVGCLVQEGGDSKSVKCSSSKQYMLENMTHYETRSILIYFFKFKSLFTNIGEKTLDCYLIMEEKKNLM